MTFSPVEDVRAHRVLELVRKPYQPSTYEPFANLIWFGVNARAEAPVLRLAQALNGQDRREAGAQDLCWLYE